MISPKIHQHSDQRRTEPRSEPSQEAPSGRRLLLTSDVVEPWGSSYSELSRSPYSPGDAVATSQVVIGKCPSENKKKIKQRPLCY
ncbi:jg16523 [Pararge aegeria aegeria]|uniref:Jg16523 protein n=1 Tax=Pararge aegeria aegeria TaxID=348720 RepID=A0A8S4SRY8_9NEOP|nr:jg16523 [Pararge aegeria aegeria]